MSLSTLNLQPELLENELIKILPLQPTDFEMLYAAAANPAVWEQHPNTDRYKKEVFQLFFEGAIKSGTAFKFIDKASGAVIGSSRFYDYREETASIALGYTFMNNAFWGGKYNKAAKELLMKHAFQFVDTVLFHIGEKNVRSQKATQKLGAKLREGVRVDFNGTQPPHLEYEIKKENFYKGCSLLTNDLT